MKRLMVFAVAAALGCGVADAGRAAAAPAVITNPDWLEKPSGKDFGRLYPAAAGLLAISGRVELLCGVATSGAVVDCRIDEETPKNEGFGAAALALAPSFKMRPRLRNGVAVGGARVRIPISFQTSAESRAPLPDPALTPDPPAEALALAQRVAARLGPDEQATGYVLDAISGVGRYAGAPIEDPVAAQNRDDAVRDYVQAAANEGAQLRRARVVALARTYSVEDLRQIAAFLETPAGAAWIAKSADGVRQFLVEAAPVVRSVTARARQAYCANRDCAPLAIAPVRVPEPPPAPPK